MTENLTNNIEYNSSNYVFENNNVEIIQNEKYEPLFELYSTGKALGYYRWNGRRTSCTPQKDRIDKICQNAGIAGIIRNDKQYLNESQLYDFMLEARTEKCKVFRKWVTNEVLPTIRKHGIYATDDTLDRIVSNPDFGIRLLTELKTEREKSKQLQSQIEKDKPKVLFAESVESSVNSVLVSDLATILKQNNINTGQNRLFKWLRDNGYLIKGGISKNLPTQYSLNLGLFEVREKTVTDRYGNYRTVFTPMVTGKGQTYFVKKFLKEKQENKVSLSEPAVICI